MLDLCIPSAVFESWLGLQRLLGRVLHNVPPQLQRVTLVCQNVEPRFVAPSLDGVGLREHTDRSLASFVVFARKQIMEHETQHGV